MDTLLQPDERVLSTLNADGSRRWLKPRLSPGRFWHKRRFVAYLLIVIFTALPYLSIGGKPAVLLDIINRRFVFFGRTLLATDTLLFALFMMIVFMTVFMLTAIFGRVWCGWACPQTVYLEFVFRPIERLLERKGGRGKKGGRGALRFVIYLLVAAFLAHTFVSYFVGVANLRHWIFGSPIDHPIAFVVILVVTGLMLFDFGFFREQLCIVACPYGRMQSVMLDRASLIVGYDAKRGEPRGKIKHAKSNGDVALDVVSDRGDCIDCTLCVQTCPTGIDIREGLQMECIHCTQCMDACDAVMEKIGKPRGLIRYSSQEALETGRSRFARPRVFVYPVILIALIAAFFVVLSTTTQARVSLTRARQPTLFNTLADGMIANNAQLAITNRTEEPAAYTLTVLSPKEVSVELVPSGQVIGPQESASLVVHFSAPPDLFTESPRLVKLRISSDGGYTGELEFSMHGPRWKGNAP